MGVPGRCKNCPIDYAPIAKGKGVSDGLMIIGEAPGVQEAYHGEPFVGPSGKLLKETLKAAHVDIENDCYFTNAVICRPDHNATPDVEHIEACSDRLRREIALVNPKKILCVGAVPLTAVLRARKPTAITGHRGRGFWSEWDGKQIYTMATYHPAAIPRNTEFFRDFAHDIQKWLASDKPMRVPVLDVLEPKTVKQAVECLNLLLEVADDTYLGCDTETTGVDTYDDSVMSWGFGAIYDWSRTLKDEARGADGMTVIVPDQLLVKSDVARVVYDLMTGRSYKGTLAFQNVKFDLKFFNYLFEEFIRPKSLVDTMLMSYLLDERPASGRYRSHGLKALARVRYDAEDYEINFDKFFKLDEEQRQAMMPQLYQYQSLDLYYTTRLAYDMERELRRDPGLARVYDELLLPGTLAFTEMEMRGVRLDIPHLESMKKDLERSIGDHLLWLQEKSGKPDLNPGSPQQVNKLLFKEWSLPQNKGASTDRKNLKDLIPKIKDPDKAAWVEKLIEFRMDAKIYKSFICSLLEKVKPDERIRSDFQLTGTVTGRLSSRNPNLQNIPGRYSSTTRNAFIPMEGASFIEADYSQLEVRVFTAFSGEPQWVQAFKDGVDLHKRVAATMLRKPEEEVTKFDRRIFKTVGFGMLYGRGAKSIVEGKETKHLPPGVKWWTLAEAEKVLAEFMQQFPHLKTWMDKQHRFALKNHYIQQPFGRKRRFPFIGRNNIMEVQRQAGNTPIQGTASDICLAALIKLHNELPEGAYVLFSVHDAIYFEVDKKILKPVLKQIRETMLGVVPKILTFTPEVPFDVEIKVGERWAEEQETET